MRRDVLWPMHLEGQRRSPDCESWPIQSGMQRDPWRIGVCCILLNRTSILQVRPMLPVLFASLPTPADMSANEGRLFDLVEPLGFGSKRTYALARFSAEFREPWRGEFGSLYGVGPYCEDAVRIFCLDDYSVKPTDRVLRAYLVVRKEAHA